MNEKGKNSENLPPKKSEKIDILELNRQKVESMEIQTEEAEKSTEEVEKEPNCCGIVGSKCASCSIKITSKIANGTKIAKNGIVSQGVKCKSCLASGASAGCHGCM